MNPIKGRSWLDDQVRAEAFRRAVLASIQPEWREDAQAMLANAERCRPLARYNTGTISEAASLYLRALTARVRPTAVAEVGTFIGASTRSIAAGWPVTRIFTCDKDNDCVPSDHQILAHPYTSSTAMFKRLRGLSVDLFFIDGRLQAEDLTLLLSASHERTVYAFDDYEGDEKGVLNVSRVHPWLNPKHSYRLVEPPESVLNLDAKTTIALLVPGALL